jgi:hypothetical protein
MPQPHLCHGKAAGRQALACAIHNKIQKSPVNPLTRHASRSVMGDNYQSLQVEGLPRYPTHCLTELHIKLQVGLKLFQQGISRLAQ